MNLKKIIKRSYHIKRMCNFVVLFVSQETMRAMGKYVGYWGSKVT